MTPVPKPRVEQLEARYNRMRPVLVTLTGGDDAALASFDKRYTELRDALYGDASCPLPRHAEVRGTFNRVPDYSEALRQLEQEFDDCLPVGAPSVSW